jgi:hypothetical protein
VRARSASSFATREKKDRPVAAHGSPRWSVWKLSAVIARKPCLNLRRISRLLAVDYMSFLAIRHIGHSSAPPGRSTVSAVGYSGGSQARPYRSGAVSYASQGEYAPRATLATPCRYFLATRCNRCHRRRNSVNFTSRFKLRESNETVRIRACARSGRRRRFLCID